METVRWEEVNAQVPKSEILLGAKQRARLGIVSSRVSPPQVKPNIFDSSPKKFLPRLLKNGVPPPQPPPHSVNLAARGRLGVTIYYGVNQVLYVLECP